MDWNNYTNSPSRDMDEREAFSLIKDQLSYSWAAQGVDPQKVAEKYEEFIDLLKGVKGEMRGDILSAFAEREIHGLRSGEFLSDPVAVYTDGAAMGEEDSRQGGTVAEINILLDCSGSMGYVDGIGSTGINALGKSNPLYLVPRFFCASLVARYMYKNLLECAAELNKSLKVRGFLFAQHLGYSTSPYSGQVWLTHPNMGSGTMIEPAIRRVRQSEIEDGEAGAARLDLIITDGIIEELVDRDNDSSVEISATQYDRISMGGSLQTIVLNILDREVYLRDLRTALMTEKDLKFPDYFVQYFAESPAVLAHLMRQLTQGFIRGL